MRHGPTLVCALLSLVTLTGSATKARAQYYLADERLGTRTAPILLLTRPDIQADLDMKPGQIKAAAHAIDRLYTKAESLRGKENSPEVIRVRAELDAAQNQWIRTTLTEAQVARLVQLDLQWEGPAALVRPVIAENLRITPEQHKALEEILRRDRQTPGRTAIGKQALAVLTPEQRTGWRILLGEPFHIVHTAAKAPAQPRR